MTTASKQPTSRIVQAGRQSQAILAVHMPPLESQPILSICFQRFAEFMKSTFLTCIYFLPFSFPAALGSLNERPMLSCEVSALLWRCWLGMTICFHANVTSQSLSSDLWRNNIQVNALHSLKITKSGWGIKSMPPLLIMLRLYFTILYFLQHQKGASGQSKSLHCQITQHSSLFHYTGTLVWN